MYLNYIRFAGTVAILTSLSSAANAQSFSNDNSFSRVSLFPRNFNQMVCLPEKTDDCDKVKVDTSQGNGGYIYTENDGHATNVSHSIAGNCLTTTGRKSSGIYRASQEIFGKCAISEHGIEDDQVFQHSAKIYCGLGTSNQENLPLMAPTFYTTSVNIHNPHYETASVRWKVVEAHNGRDGKIKKGFVHSTIGPDQGQFFDCDKFWSNALTPIDGFFVIESDLPLDAYSYYTAAEKVEIVNGEVQIDLELGPAGQIQFTGPAEIDVERHPERIVRAGEYWYCPTDPRTPLNALTPDGLFSRLWKKSDGTFANKISNSNDFSYSDNPVASLPGNYEFTMDICVCGDTKESEARIVWESVDSDDTSEWYKIDGTTGSPYNFHSHTPQNAPQTIATTNLTEQGNNRIRVIVNQIPHSNQNSNEMHITALGHIQFTNAYAGTCR